MSELDTDAQHPETEAALDVEVGAAAPAEPAPAVLGDLGDRLPHPPAGPVALDPDLALVLEVPVDLVVEIGRTRMTIRETLTIGRGSIIALDKLAGEPADLLVNGRLIARGEVIAIDEEFGFRVTDVVSPERRLEAGRQ
jgi:flagellar motor switch protein FliN/FliY